MRLEYDLVIVIIGFVISFIGGQFNNLITMFLGLVIVILSMYLVIKNKSEDIIHLNDEITILKAQINTHRELNKIWVEINGLKKKKK